MARSKMLEEFFKGQYGKGLMKQASTTKKVAYDQDSYWEGDKQGPTQDEISIAHPGGGHTTQVSNSGGGGEGIYEVGMSDVKSVDSTVETVTEIGKVHEDVARKEPTGVQGSTLKGITKSSAKDVKDKMKKLREMRKKKGRLEKLIRIADKLDELECAEEANLVDEIIQEETGALEAETNEAKSEEATASE